MAALQGRVGVRSSYREVQAGQQNDSVIQRSAVILSPLLDDSLYPGVFSGDIGLSLHIHGGIVGLIKENRTRKTAPGGDTPKPVSPDECRSGNVLQSAMRDLRSELAMVASDFFGTITLNLQIDRGMCTMVLCTREQSHRLIDGAK